MRDFGSSIVAAKDGLFSSGSGLALLGGTEMPKVIGPMEKLAARYFPGVPVIPSMTTGATDGTFLIAIGIPVYGVPGLWMDPDGNGAHGLDERMEVRALYTGRDYLMELVKTYANAS